MFEPWELDAVVEGAGVLRLAPLRCAHGTSLRMTGVFGVLVFWVSSF